MTLALETVACYGEACVDYLLTGVTDLPVWGTSTPISTLTRHPGGNAVNCAIAIAKLSHANALPIVKIGQDGDGNYVKRGLLEGGIPEATLETFVVVDQAMRTAAVVVLVQQEGSADRAFLHSNPYPAKKYGGFGSPTVDEMRVRLKAMNEVRFHHFAGIGSFDAVTRPEIVRLIREIREVTADTIITADTAPEKTLGDERVRLSLKAFLDSVDYFMPSDFEAAMLTGNPDPSDYETSVQGLRQRFQCKNIIIKIHERGAYLVDERGQAAVVHPYHLADPTDSTGAGDAWCAGFLSGLVDGRTPLDSCELGNAAAHYCIQAIGATTNIPSFSSIAEVVRDHQSSRLKVFISHADVDVARTCAYMMAKEGATPILDSSHLDGGQLEAEVSEMIAASNAVIVLVTAEALKSDWVQWEIEESTRLHRSIYPIMASSLPDTDVKKSVLWSALRRKWHWSSSDALESTGMRRLLAAIRNDLK